MDTAKMNERLPELVVMPHAASQRNEHRSIVHWFVRAGNPEGSPVTGWTINLSLTGMLVKMPVAYTIGDMVEFEIWTSLLASVRIAGLVVRCEHSRHGSFYGVQFAGM